MGRTRVTEAYRHSRDYYRNCGSHIRNFIRDENISSEQILGVGIALTALLSRDRRSVKKSILLGSSETTIEDFEEWIDYPCQLYHDSEAAANAELWSSPDITDAMYLGINQYLNGMLIMNGKVHVGREFSGGIVEHLTLYPGGRTCYCGKRGCLTCYCSGHVLYSEEKGARDKFFADLRGGDAEAVQKWNQFIADMAIAIGSLYSVLDCDFILGGTAGAYMTEEDVERLQQLVRKDFHYAPADGFIRLGHKDVDVCARGAAISYVKQFVENM
jgi:predicted NBD/HSP70 family sugar kinase